MRIKCLPYDFVRINCITKYTVRRVWFFQRGQKNVRNHTQVKLAATSLECKQAGTFQYTSVCVGGRFRLITRIRENQWRIIKKIGIKSGLLNTICRIQIDHIIGLIKSVRSVLCAAVCRGSVWRPCLFVYIVARPIFCTK